MNKRKTKEAEPWERQPGESDQAWEAFLLYRDMSHEDTGPKKKRRLATVADKLGKSVKLIERWSRNWGWVERCREYDNELQRIGMEETRSAVKQMLKTHIAFAQALQKKALQALSRLDEDDMSARNILDYLAQGIALERQARIETAEMSSPNASKDSPLAVLEEPENSAMLQLVDSLHAAREERRGK